MARTGHEKVLQALAYKVLVGTNGADLFGQPQHSIVEVLKKRLKITGNKARDALQGLQEEGFITIVGGKVLNSKSSVGTFFFLNPKQGGQIVAKGQDKPLIVPAEYCGNYVSGSTVNFIVNENGQAMITGLVSVSDTTPNGIKVAPNKILAGMIVQNDNGDFEFMPRHKAGQSVKPLIVLSSDKKQLREMLGKIVTVTVNNFVGGEDTCVVRKVYGLVGSPMAEMRALAESAGVILERSDRAIEEMQHIPSEVDYSKINLVHANGTPIDPAMYDGSKPDYIDLRDKLFTTIDPADCQDMDDAVYTEIDENGNYVTYAAIADVTEYVRPGMALWNEAMQQGFTLYVPGSAFDMLPHDELAAGICSLNPNVDRLTLCMKSVIDPATGERIGSEIVQAVINSKQKLSYNLAQQKFDEWGDAEIDRIYAQMVARAKREGKVIEPATIDESLVLNKKVADAIWKFYNSRSTLKLADDQEIQFVLSEDKTDVLDLEPRIHLPSMELIEALMINANEVAAEFSQKHHLNTLYRVHGEPGDFKAERLRSFMECLGVSFNGDVSNTSLQRLIDQVTGQDYEAAAKHVIKTSLDKAKYSYIPHPTDASGEVREDLLCHNALSSPLYLHITAGIRRDCDLIAQHAIKEFINHGRVAFSEDYVKECGLHLSSRETAIDNADALAQDICAAIYAEKHINDIVEGKVRVITDRCIVIETPKRIKIEIPVEDFAEKYSIPPSRVALMSNGKVILTLGDTVKAKISGADRVEGKVYASTHMEKTYTNPYEYNPENPLASVERSLNRQGVDTATSQTVSEMRAYVRLEQEKEEKRRRIESQRREKEERERRRNGYEDFTKGKRRK